MCLNILESMKPLMVEDRDSESVLELKARLYPSESKIRQDQEKVVDSV